MKKFAILIMLSVLGPAVHASDDPYSKAMKEGMKLLDEAQGPQDYLAAANKFDRIFDAQKDKWQPAYYASFAMTLVAAMESDGTKKDSELDAAQSYLDKASSLEHAESEVLALQGFIHMLRIGVDPASRGQQYSGMSAAALQKAKAMDPENPRVLYMLAQLSYGTAMFFGADTSEACKMNDLALEKFEAFENIEDPDPFAPKWGKNMALGFRAQCGN